MGKRELRELTDPFCRAAKAVDGRQTDYFDKLATGLCLRASPGGTRTWYLLYTRPGNQKRARMKLGRYPDMSLAVARDAAKDARIRIRKGGDPGREKATGQTVAHLVENYLNRSTTKRSGKPKRSLKEIARRLRKNVAGVIGAIKLADLHRRDITQCIDTVKDRGAGVEANRVFEDMRAMVRWAHARGDLDSNLMEGMGKPTGTTPRERELSADEIRIVWHALPDAEMRESSRNVLRLCLVTAQRVGEVAGMTRAEIDLQSRVWTIPAERSKNGDAHKVPLSDMAIDIIRNQLAAVDDLCKRKRRKVPPFVFPAPGGRQAVSGGSIAKAVKREEVTARVTLHAAGKPSALTMGVESWTPHDLRRTAATQMEELGISPIVIGHVLNHASVTKATITSKIYARYDYAREKREALDLWAGRLSGILTGPDVVPIRRSAT